MLNERLTKFTLTCFAIPSWVKLNTIYLEKYDQIVSHDETFYFLSCMYKLTVCYTSISLYTNREIECEWRLGEITEQNVSKFCQADYILRYLSAKKSDNMFPVMFYLVSHPLKIVTLNCIKIDSVCSHCDVADNCSWNIVKYEAEMVCSNFKWWTSITPYYYRASTMRACQLSVPHWYVP